MSDFSVCVPLVPIVILLLVMLDIRRVSIATGGRKPRLHRRQWLGLALAAAAFAVGDFVVLLIDGGFLKHMLLIAPAITISVFFLYRAQYAPA